MRIVNGALAQHRSSKHPLRYNTHYTHYTCTRHTTHAITHAIYPFLFLTFRWFDLWWFFLSAENCRSLKWMFVERIKWHRSRAQWEMEVRDSIECVECIECVRRVINVLSGECVVCVKYVE
jgi:hypothetical protein